MKREKTRLRFNTAALTIVLLTVLLWSFGAVSIYEKQVLTENRFKNSLFGLPGLPKLSPKAIRVREKIKVYEGVPSPIVVAPGEKTPVFHKIQTNEPVVFITIDDGIFKNDEGSEFMQDRALPATAFLTNDAVKNNYHFFSNLKETGTVIENHTMTHHALPKMPFDKQKAEICGASDKFQEVYGIRPTLFRPPYGEYNDDTLRAAAACGIKATILWNVVVNNRALNYQKQQKLMPGDIILLHYRPELKSDLEALLRSIQEQNMQIGLLEDWIK